MKKFLMATTAAGLLAAAGANAGTPTIKIGGYADAQVGVADQDNLYYLDTNAAKTSLSLNQALGLGNPSVAGLGVSNPLSRGFNSATDTELYIDVDGDTDWGLQYGAHITLEADTNEPGDQLGLAGNSGKTYLYLQNEQAGRIEGGATSSAASQFQVGAQTLARATGGVGGDFHRYVDLDGSHIGLPGGRRFYSLPGLFNDVNPLAIEGGFEQNLATANKLTYISPDIYGARIGVSYTPDNLERGSDKGFASRVEPTALGGTGVNFEHIVDAGLHYKNQFSNGLGVEASATGQMGETKDTRQVGGLPVRPDMDDLRAYNGGVNLSYMGATVGGSYGRADEMGGPAGVGTEGQYWNLGGAYVYGPFGASVTYMQSEIENDAFVAGAWRDSEFDNLSVGADYQLAPGLVPYVEVSFFDADSNVAAVRDNNGTVFISGVALSF